MNGFTQKLRFNISIGIPYTFSMEHENTRKYHPLEWNDYIMRTQTTIKRRLEKMMRYADRHDLLLLLNPNHDEYMYYFEIPTHFIWRFDPVNFNSKIILRKPDTETLFDIIEHNQMDSDLMYSVFLGQEHSFRLHS
jgi:hypothetical protein